MDTKKILNPGFLVPFAFFLGLLLLGLAVSNDYGSFWDEGIERYSGIVNLNAVAHMILPRITRKIEQEKGVTIQPLAQYGNRYYGVVLQVPLAGWEMLNGFSLDKRHMWQERHLILFLFVFLSSIFLFFLLKKSLGHWGFGLLGVAFFWATPRFFAESFYNIKDVGFLAAFIIGFFFLIRFYESSKPGRAVAVGILSAFAAGVRLLGGAFIVFAFLFDAWKLKRHEISLKNFLVRTLALVASFGVFLVLFYPASWNNPFKFFLEAATVMGNYPWYGNMLFLGNILNPHQLPWYYLPVWIFITTPIPVLLFFAIGLGTGFISLLKKNYSLTKLERALWSTSVLLIVGFLILVFVMKPTLYDGWRHFYFLYAPIIAIAVIGVAESWSFAFRVWRAGYISRLSVSVIALLLAFSPVCFWMIRNHPFQYVYFNSLARPSAFTLFERDYWGVSEIKGLEYIMRTDSRSTIKLVSEGPILQISEMLPEKDRLRIEWVKTPEEADYKILTFRTTVSDQVSGNEVFFVKVDGHRILSVVKNG